MTLCWSALSSAGTLRAYVDWCSPGGLMHKSADVETELAPSRAHGSVGTGRAPVGPEWTSGSCFGNV